jgi:hypothetical protein|tara:strand:+ start:1238 stop:1399 length:162 start_codon:yes stop_codon:yes gene_type:complete
MEDNRLGQIIQASQAFGDESGHLISFYILAVCFKFEAPDHQALLVFQMSIFIK